MVLQFPSRTGAVSQRVFRVQSKSLEAAGFTLGQELIIDAETPRPGDWIIVRRNGREILKLYLLCNLNPNETIIGKVRR